jgi:7,8-dihydropterin-6-yl-methyl-4-(beta-D-ribofuranosyl)aminobenzene 5'-phosphate synthase
MSRHNETILFDTGGSPAVFRRNMQALGLDLEQARALIISHWHSDHWRAIPAALEMFGRRGIPVYVPAPNPEQEAKIGAAGGKPVVAAEDQVVTQAASTTGRQGDAIKEHGLVIDVIKQGLILLTGCAHPGLLTMVRTVKRNFPKRSFCAVIGGFHLGTLEEGREVARQLLPYGFRLVSPCHCTSTAAKQGLREVLGDDIYRDNGAGTVLHLQ